MRFGGWRHMAGRPGRCHHDRRTPRGPICDGIASAWLMRPLVDEGGANAACVGFAIWPALGSSVACLLGERQEAAVMNGAVSNRAMLAERFRQVADAFEADDNQAIDAELSA
jgi:hypothetical protein